MLKEFKAFILRGNVMDLAVGVIIGAAFSAVVNSLVQDVFTPLLGLINLPDLREAAIDLSPKGLPAGDIAYGKVLNAVISFILMGAVVFFFVVKPLNRVMGRDKAEPTPDMRECPHCLTSIRVAAKVCAHCAREVGA